MHRILRKDAVRQVGRFTFTTIHFGMYVCMCTDIHASIPYTCIHTMWNVKTYVYTVTNISRSGTLVLCHLVVLYHTKMDSVSGCEASFPCTGYKFFNLDICIGIYTFIQKGPDVMFPKFLS